MAISNRRCSICGQRGHNARTCTHNKQTSVTQAMVDTLNELMGNTGDKHPTLILTAKNEVAFKETPEISGRLAVNYCRWHLGLSTQQDAAKKLAA